MVSARKRKPQRHEDHKGKTVKVFFVYLVSSWFRKLLLLEEAVLKKLLLLSVLLLAMPGCSLTIPGSGPTVGEFQGYYTAQFESSVFRPCGAPEKTAYWMDVWGVPDFNKRYEELGGLGTRVYLSFKGELSPYSLNGYGHLNAYRREMKILDLHEMSVEKQCP